MNITRKELENIAEQKLYYSKKDNGLILATTYDDTNLLEDSTEKTQKPYEWFQVFDQNDQPVVVERNDVVLYRKECHGPKRIRNLYHRGAGAFIVSKEHELLVPIRAPDKDLFPSMGDVSVAEHVNVRESYFDAVLRGFQEEQGVSVEPKQLKLIMKTPVIDSEQSEMCEYYLFQHQGEKYQISDETSSQRWIPIRSLVGKDIGKELNFRPDQLPALESFVAGYKF